MVSEEMKVVLTDYNVAYKRNPDSPETCEYTGYDYPGAIIMKE
jgi:hypothetical protein